MKFSKWLKKREIKETDTSDVAVFARPLGSSPHRRQWPWTEEDPFFKKLKKKRKRGKIKSD